MNINNNIFMDIYRLLVCVVGGVGVGGGCCVCGEKKHIEKLYFVFFFLFSLRNY